MAGTPVPQDSTRPGRCHHGPPGVSDMSGDSPGGPRAIRHRATGPRRGRPALDRAAVLDAAIRLADRDGVAAVTMRALAESLGVSAMSLYAHVPDKDAVLDAILDDRLRRLDPISPRLPWRDRLVASFAGLCELLVSEPALLERYGHRPVVVEAALDRADRALGVLLDAGFDPDEAVAAFAALHSYTIGFAFLGVARHAPSPSRTDPGAAQRHGGYWPAYFAGLDPQRYPQLVRLRPDLSTLADQGQFRAGLRALVDGLAHTFAGHERAKP